MLNNKYAGVSECGGLSLLAGGFPGSKPPNRWSFVCGHTVFYEDLVLRLFFNDAEGMKPYIQVNKEKSVDLMVNLVFSVTQRGENRK